MILIPCTAKACCKGFVTIGLITCWAVSSLATLALVQMLAYVYNLNAHQIIYQIFGFGNSSNWLATYVKYVIVIIM